MKKYFAVFTIHIQDAMTYRVRMFVWLLIDLVWMIVLPFVWLAVYGDAPTVGGYDKRMIISYFFYLPFINSSLVFYTYYYMNYQIKEGRVIPYLTKPIQYLLYATTGESAYRAWQSLTVLLLMSGAYFLVGDWVIPPSVPDSLPIIIPVFFTTLLLSAQFATLIGMIGFWTVQAQWVTHFWWMLGTFTTGYLAPTSFYPEWAQNILYYSPFPLLIQVPLEAVMGRLAAPEAIHWIGIGVIWGIILFGLNIIVWRRGVRRVDAVGM